MVRSPRRAAPSEPPPLDAYSLRLVSSRTLYDLGVALQRSPALAGLAVDAVLRMNPTDHERLGVATGGTREGHLVAHDTPGRRDCRPGVARGVVALGFNRPGTRAADLIDATALVTDVRVETP